MLTIATQFTNPKDSLYRSLLGWGELSGPPETDILPPVLARADVKLEKTTYSAALGIAERLRNRVPRSVYVCGVDTDACVMAAAIGLFDLGLRPVVLADACASSGGLALHLSALEIMRRNLGRKQVWELAK